MFQWLDIRKLPTLKTIETMRIRIAPHAEGLPEDGGDPQIPTSKSHAQRALCLAAFLPVETVIEDLPASRDVKVLSTALQDAPAGVLQLLDNGTAMRILSVLLPLLGEKCALDGGPRLKQRPLTASVEFLERYGGNSTEEWPRRFSGRGVDWPEHLEIDASLSTQPASGVLLGAALRLARQGQRHCVHIQRPAAHDYLLVTIEVLKWFGFTVDSWWVGDDLVVDVAEWSTPAPGHTVRIPVDASSFTFYAGLMATHGRPIQPPSDCDPHPDWLFTDDLDRLLNAPPGEVLKFHELHRRPDTFPCLAALAALRHGKTEFTDVPALRLKESDRIHAMSVALTALGAGCQELPDGLIVEGPLPVHEAPVDVPTPDDHRIVMAIALLGTRIPGGVVVDNAAAVDKSWPGYFDWLGRVAQVSTVSFPPA